MFILLYHDLDSIDFPNEKTNLATRGTIVTANQFESQIKYLAENNYESISIKDYFGYITQKKQLPSKKIIITFDDGHYSNYHVALPILLKYKFKAIFFIIASRINQPYHLSEDQIIDMANKGMEIASHGLTHKYLLHMDHNEIWHELLESKWILESVVKQSINYFAFPGGHYNENVLKLLKRAGYKGACSCLQGKNAIKTNPFLLKRIEIRGNVTNNKFKQTFNIVYIECYQFIDLVKRSFRKAMGLNTYSNIRSKFYKYYIFKR